MVKGSPTSLTTNYGHLSYIQNKKHTKQETYTQTTNALLYKYREVQSDNIKLEFNLIFDLNAECEATNTLSKGKLFHNETHTKKRSRAGTGSGERSVKR